MNFLDIKKKIMTKEERTMKYKEYQKTYREKNKDKSKRYAKNYYNDNINKFKENAEKYYLNNVDKLTAKQNEYRLENIDKIKEYRLENRDKINKYQREYRIDNKEFFMCRDLLSNTFKRLGREKQGLTIELLGYSPLELKNHLEVLFTDGMTWDNYGEWHIDHVIPVSLFDKDTLPSVVNKLSNLQPLWATTREINGVVYEGNLNKNNKINIQ